MAEGFGIGKQRLAEEIVKRNWNIENPSSKLFRFSDLLFIMSEMESREGTAYLSQHSSKRGHHIFREFVKMLLYRNLANFDSMVLISADKGIGKSSAAMMIAKEWCKLIGIRFDPKRHIAYNNSELMTKIDKLNKFEPLIADESVRFVSSEDWAKAENKSLKKKLAQVRTKHLLYILCFPLKIKKVDKVYLESFVSYWIDLFTRGKGAVFIKDKNPYNDSWRMKEFTNIGAYTEFTDKDQIEAKLKTHPNFWQIVSFPKPNESLYKHYMEIREKNVYDEETIFSSVTREDIHRALLILTLRDLMMDDTNLTMNRVILHIRNEYDIALTKGMLQAALEDAKQLVIKIKEQAIE